jgi:hypothetical protein
LFYREANCCQLNKGEEGIVADVFELSDRLIEHGITRIQIAKAAGRSLGHVCMILNGQRHMSAYLAEVIEELIEQVETIKDKQ